jgi:O-antigen/teichoic acid export membrane protein
MATSTRFFFKNAVWTIGGYGVSQVLRLVTNIVLARLLAPQLFGLMTIVTSLRIGIEFLSDLGIGQNVIYHKEANDPEFYNTAWTLQAIRGFGVWLMSLILTIPIAQFYELPILELVIPIVTFTGVLAGFFSINLPLLQKRLLVARLNIFDAIVAAVGSAGLVMLAYMTPTIWALVLGSIFGVVVKMIGSYFLLSDVKQRFRLSKRFVSEIFHFGKWIFLSSIIYFLSTYFDRLFFAKVVSLELLGIYGIARSISEVLGSTVLRFGNYVLFPFIASHAEMPHSELRNLLASIRAKFLLLAGIGFSLMVTLADVPIKILYDQRYQAATWMLPVLVVGAWFSLLASVNESTLLGVGKPSYSAISNALKFAFLMVALPLSAMTFGLFGGIVVVAISDLFRYVPILIGQRREQVSFGLQDLLVTILVFLLIGFWEWLRWIAGFGTSFETMLIKL